MAYTWQLGRAGESGAEEDNRRRVCTCVRTWGKLRMRTRARAKRLRMRMRSCVKMSRGGEQGNSGSSQQSASDAEFRASFSLLPHVNNILASLSQSDHSAVEKTVGYTVLHCDML